MLSRAKPSPGGRRRLLLLGEQHRVARARAVHLGRRLEHDAAHRRRLLAGREQLDRAHHVEFLERRASAGARRVGRRRGVHHGVDVAVADDLGDERVTDVGADELRAAHPAQQILARRDRVDGDDVVDQRVLRQPGGQIPAEEPARPGDQHDLGVVQGAVVAAPSHGPPERPCGIHPDSLVGASAESYLPSFLRCTRVRRSSLRCFFFDMRLRRFLMTEPMNSAT